MWTKEVTPRLRERIAGDVIKSRTLKTAGISEGGIDEMVAHLLSSTNPTIGVYAKFDGIHLRITSKASTEPRAQELLADMEVKVREAVKDSIWGIDEETLEANVGRLLKDNGLTVAIMESCTGGLLASYITDVPGSSSYFKGGLVSYTNQMKIDYGVDAAIIRAHGAVSRDTAELMAKTCRGRLGADIGVGITGVAGPDSSEGKPPGTVHIGIADSKGVAVSSHSVPGTRDFVKHRTAVMAMFELQRMLQEEG
jgi:nicotinamide-nucleotide amidase